MAEIVVPKTGEEFRKLVTAQDAMEFINGIIREPARILMDTPATLEEEQNWVDEQAKNIDKKTGLFVLLMDNGKMVGNCMIRTGRWKEKHNVSFGMAVARDYRRRGYGKALLSTAIEIAKKELKPHKIWIEVYSGNHGAKALYEKLGFVEVARLKEYEFHDGQWEDKIEMEYRDK